MASLEAKQPDPLEGVLYPSRFAVESPHTPAIVMVGGGERRTYAELDAAANRVAHLFRRAGLRRGDHVAFVLPNCARFFDVYWGADRSGLYYTPINTHLGVDEVAYIVADCGAKAVVIAAEFDDLCAQLLPRLADDVILRLTVDGSLEGYDCLDEATEGLSDAPIDDPTPGASMYYSSGTTGRPKGIERPLPTGELGHPDVFMRMISRLHGFDRDTRMLVPAPLYHGAGGWYAPAMQRIGAAAFVMERFSPDGLLEAIQRHRITHVFLVPTMFVRLLRMPTDERLQFDLSSLRFAVHAAAPCPLAVKREMLQWWGPIIHEYYSATEAIGYTFITPDEWLAHPGSVGRAMLGVPHVVDEYGNELGPGAVGTLYFEPPVPFRYHNDRSKTAATYNDRGWATVGDVGYMDADGYVFLTDRSTFMVISGGVNIYPREVEDTLLLHPAVADVAVFGIPDPEMGEAVKALVQLSAGYVASDEIGAELIAFSRAQLAHYKCPRTVDFVESLPRDPSGKLFKRQLRDAFWTSEGPRI